MKLIIHVGDMKTGTTSIQAALAAGNIPDVGIRVAYPGDTMNHNDLAPALAKAATDGIRPRVARLRQMVADARTADICVISAEGLSNGDPAIILSEIARWLADLADEVWIIQYARPHFGYLTSRYIEAVKTGVHGGTIEEWVERMIAEGRHRICDRADVWAATLGDRFTIRPFLRDQLVRGDVVADFVQCLLGDLPDDWTPPPPNNEALPADAIEALKILHRQTGHLPRSFRAPLGRHFATIHAEMFGDRPAPKVRPAPALAQRIHDACLEDACRLDARHFGGRGVMQQALNRDLGDCLSDRQPDPVPLTASDLTGILGRLVAELAEVVDADALGQGLHKRRQTALTQATMRQ